MNWEALPKPAEAAENRLINAILDGTFPIHSSLPGERDLAAMLGVTRPTLREALQRLAREGWLEIRHGRPTRVRDYWQEGSLGVLSILAQNPAHLPVNFVSQLLTVRLCMAPTYTRLAVELHPAEVAALLETCTLLEDTAQIYASADWNLHHNLCTLSGNPVFTLILNGFQSMYQHMGLIYFQPAEARRHSDTFYRALLEAARSANGPAAEEISRRIMQDSIALWQQTLSPSSTGESTEHHVAN